MIVQEHSDGRVAVALHRAGQLVAEPAGGPIEFSAPLDAAAREDLRWYLEDYLTAPFGVYEERGPAIAARLAGWGEALFEALFGAGKPGRDAYLTARAGPAELVLVSDSAEFLSLPWELLKDPKRPTPLALELAGIDRALPSEVAAERQSAPGEALRVLMVIARPGGIADVGYRMIARPLLERLEPVSGRVELEVLRPPTLDALEAKLSEAVAAGRPYQILHFDGHGVLAGGQGAGPGGRSRARFEIAAGQGHVLFEGSQGGEDPVPADAFASVLKQGRVPLVVLNACQSGTLGAVTEAAIATRLLEGGTAAVVAMGYSVYVVAAAEFMAAFYQALFAGETVSRAVAAGRLRLHAKKERPSPKGPMALEDWIVPVHYLRREVRFAELKPEPGADALSLDAALDRLRQAPPREAGEGVHVAGSLDPEGRFVGRDAAFYALELAARLQRVVVVHGPGGTGKTELAKAFARWWRDSGGVEHPSRIFFHSFEPGVASFGLDGVVMSIGLNLFGPDFVGQTADATERRSVVLDALRQHRMLLVWDNFESVHSMPDRTGATPPLDEGARQEIADFLQALAREGGESALIVTSRTAEDWLGELRHLELGGLPPAEAAELADDLLAPYPRPRARRADKAFAELLAWLDGHPLSLRLMLPQLESTSPAALLAALRGQGALPPGFEEAQGRLASLGASVKYSLDHLDPEVRDLLPALSLFEGVADEDVLGAFLSQDGVPERFSGVTKARWAAALSAAAGVGLVTALGGGSYRLHPALPAYLGAQWRGAAGAAFEAERPAALRALLGAYAGFGMWLLQQIEGGSAETAFVMIALQRRTMGHLLGLALGEGRHKEAQAILQPLNHFWEARGLTQEARGWVDRCRAVLEAADGRAPGFDTEAGALWLFMVGAEAERARAAGDPAAAEATYGAIRKSLEAAPKNESRDRRLAVMYHQLGVIAQDRGELGAAEAWYKKALEIEEALGNRPGMASSYHELGVTAQVRGEPGAAEDWYKKSLELEEALGNRPGMATSYHQLGMVAQDRGDLGAAKAWYKKSLEIQEALGNRPGVASSCHELGRVAQDRGELEAAEDWYKKSLEIAEALGDRPKMAMTYGQLGLLSEKRGNDQEALDWTVRCVALFAEFAHPATGPAPHHLARLTAKLGKAALAASWRRSTGAALPAAIRDTVAEMIEALGDAEK